ncbi:MAG: ABC transporter six-transmembrane domain-containing protein [Bacteroidales bacterium]|nr:ABC transporter six-transmembrane domain-containing protein [Bacteroidales bacterium]
MTIISIIKKFKFSISLVLSFVLLENIAWIIEPTFFGKLLDALIDKFYIKEQVNYLLPLFIWIIVYLINVAGGTMHRLLSGKTYAKIYADTATNVILYSKKKGHTVSKMFARAELAKEYIDFLKERLPEVTWQLSATFGAIIALFFYDWRIAAVALLVIIPVAIINNIYRKNVVTLQKELHDTREDQYKIFEVGNTQKIEAFYNNMVVPQTKIARWSSVDYSIIKVLLMVIFIVVLFIAVDVDKFSTGKIYAIVSYIWTFIASTDYLPGLMESLTAVRELNTRLKEEKV